MTKRMTGLLLAAFLGVGAAFGAAACGEDRGDVEVKGGTGTSKSGTGTSPSTSTTGQ